MKQKNVILMVVAIGIGLAAAFLTSQLGARSGGGPEMMKVIVAKQELPVGTLIDEQKLDDLITTAEFPRGTLPPEVVQDVNLIKGKRLTRTLRRGDKFVPSDLAEGRSIKIPEGKQVYAIRMDAVKAVAGFALPGSEVDVLLTETLASGKKRSSILLRKMLVVAVDILDRYPEGGKPAVPQLNSVSLAVTPEEGQMLALAQARGEIQMMLRDRDSEDVKEIDPIVSLPIDDNKGTGSVTAQPQTVTLPVARKAIELGTRITDSNVDDLFRMYEFVAPGPASAVRGLDDLRGKYLAMPLAPEQWVPQGALVDKDPKVEPVQPKLDEPAEPRNVLHHRMTIQSGAHRTVATYESEGSGGYQLVEPGARGRPVPAPRPAGRAAPAPVPPPPPAPPADDKLPVPTEAG